MTSKDWELYRSYIHVIVLDRVSIPNNKSSYYHPPFVRSLPDTLVLSLLNHVTGPKRFLFETLNTLSELEER